MDINELVKQYGPKLSSLSARMIHNNNIAREKAQEVWFEIIKNIDQFRAESKISTWIYTIARRTIMHYACSERVITHQAFEYHFNRKLFFSGSHFL